MIPHSATIKFNIFIHELLPNGSINPEIVDCSEEFKNFDMSNLADISITECSKEECIKRVKQILEKIHG